MEIYANISGAYADGQAYVVYVNPSKVPPDRDVLRAWCTDELEKLAGHEPENVDFNITNEELVLKKLKDICDEHAWENS